MSRSRGSHSILSHPDGGRVVAAYHRLGATLPVETLKGMIATTGLAEADLERLGFVLLLPPRASDLRPSTRPVLCASGLFRTLGEHHTEVSGGTDRRAGFSRS